MANFPVRPRDDERKFGVEVFNGRQMVRYNPQIAEDILDRVAGGEKLRAICESDDKYPRWTTFMNWTRKMPDLLKAYEAALEVSALAFEEKALDLADELAGENAFTQTKVQAYKAAMDQYRWSAEKRNPKRYGQRSQTGAVVPIQIITNLDLGQGKQIEDVYTLPTVPDGPVEAFVDTEVEEMGPEAEPRVRKAPLPAPPPRSVKEKLRNKTSWGPDNPPPKSPGRPKKGHKSPGALAKTLANRQNALLRRANKEKS